MEIIKFTYKLNIFLIQFCIAICWALCGTHLHEKSDRDKEREKNGAYSFGCASCVDQSKGLPAPGRM